MTKFMESENYKITEYNSHICKQLIHEFASSVNLDMFIRKNISPSKEFCFEDIVEKDDLYIQSVAKLLYEKIDYYIKKLHIKVENYKIIDIKYEYYDKTEKVEGSDIEFEMQDSFETS